MILAWLVAVPVQAHDSIGTVSNSVVVVHGPTVDYYMTVPARLKPLMFATTETAYYQDYFNRTQTVTSAGKRCPQEAMSPFSKLPSGDEIVQLSYRCPTPVSRLAISSEALLDVDDKHVQTVKLVDPNDLEHVISEGILDLKHRDLALSEVQGGSSLLASRIVRFVKLGIEHILTGYDHILFIITIILVTTGIREAVRIVTSFTIAHSITLALAFFNVVSLPSSVVEPLIALTIVYAAFENLYLKSFRTRWLLVFGFGLIHGLGFVDVLKQLTFSKGELISSLVSFNAGIEIGQLLIVIPLVVALGVLRRHAWQPAAVRYASFATGLAGMVWLLDRLPLQPVYTMLQEVI